MADGWWLIADQSDHILEMVNNCFHYLDTHDATRDSWRYKKDTDYTYRTHRVNDGLETLLSLVNPSDVMKRGGRERNHLSANTPIMKVHEETKLFLEIVIAATTHSFIHPLGTGQSGNSFLAQIAMQYRNVCICITPPFERPGRVHERLSALLLALVWTTSMQFVGRTWTVDRWQVTCDRARDENHFLMLRNWNVETNQESINLFLSWNQY